MPGILDTFIKTQRGKTTADKVAEAERLAMGGKPKPKPQKKKTRNITDGSNSVDYYEN